MARPFVVEVELGEHGVAHLHLEGELDLHTGPVLEDSLAQLGADVWCVRLDASQLEFIDASGLRSLLAAELRFGPGRVIVERPSCAMVRLLEICDLMHLLQGAGDEGGDVITVG